MNHLMLALLLTFLLTGCTTVPVYTPATAHEEGEPQKICGEHLCTEVTTHHDKGVIKVLDKEGRMLSDDEVKVQAMCRNKRQNFTRRRYMGDWDKDSRIHLRAKDDEWVFNEREITDTCYLALTVFYEKEQEKFEYPLIRAESL